MTNSGSLTTNKKLSSWLALALSLLAGASVSLFLGQDRNWDLLNYHYYNPYAWLTDRYQLDIAPAQRQTFLNPLLDIPFYTLIHFINDKTRLIAILMGAWHGLNYYVLWLIAKLLFVDDKSSSSSLCVAGVAVLIGATGASLFPVIGSTMNDAPATTLILTALFLLLRDVQTGGVNSRAVWLAGGAAGLAVGLKLTTASYALALMFSLAGFYGPRRLLPQAIRFCLAAGLGFALTDGFFLWKMWRLFENPLFPFYNNIFQSPYADPLAFDDRRFLPKTFWMALAYPFIWGTKINSLVSEPPLRDPRFAVVLLCWGIVSLMHLATPRPRPAVSKTWTGLVLFWGGTYLIWLKQFAIFRYLAGLELLTGIFICAAITKLFRSRRQALLASIGIAVLIIAATKLPRWGRLPFSERMIDVNVPSLPQGSTVLFLSNSPMSFVIPFFDKNTRFIGLNNNFLSIGQINILNERAKHIIQNEQCPLFEIDFTQKGEDTARAFSDYGIELVEETCNFIDFNGSKRFLRICQLRRVKQSLPQN